MYCNNCKINWASLPSQDDEIGDEQYEYCPTCFTGEHLSAPKAGPKYAYAINGRIFDIDSGKNLEIKKTIPVAKPYKKFNPEEWQRKKEEREARENKAIEAYIRTFQKKGKKAAEKIFFEKMKK
jgi:hypothetical protein